MRASNISPQNERATNSSPPCDILLCGNDFLMCYAMLCYAMLSCAALYCTVLRTLNLCPPRISSLGPNFLPCTRNALISTHHLLHALLRPHTAPFTNLVPRQSNPSTHPLCNQALAIVCSPFARSGPTVGMFRLTDPGLGFIQACRLPGPFHPHLNARGQPVTGLYTDSFGHVLILPDQKKGSLSIRDFRR